ncbi:thermosome subunit alpha [Chloroflexota bacterium]
MAALQRSSSHSPLSEGGQRIEGKDAQRMNIMAARIITESIKTTLGPRGMDKMLVDSLGDVVVTNDGATILREMNLDHPVGKMMVEVARTQEAVVGDGTTTAVVIAGELLKNAQSLLDENIHPTIIARGYRMAAKKALEILDNVAITISYDEEIFQKIALTTITGKGVDKAKEHLSVLVVKAILAVTDEEEGKISVKTEDIKLEKLEGGGIENTEFVKGIIMDKEKVHPSMPQKVNDARIFLTNFPLELRGKELDGRIRITDPNQMKAFTDEEMGSMKRMIEIIKNSGATVMLSQKGIDELGQYYLANAGILAVRRVKKGDIEKLAKATGASIVSNIEELGEQDLGYAGLVEQVKIDEHMMIQVTECLQPKAVSILIRGATSHVTEEVERAIEDCLGAVPAAMEDKKIVAGGGAAEIEMAERLRAYARTIGGKEQLAIEAFADSLEAIPRALAENAGLDSIDMLVKLKSAYRRKGSSNTGLDIFDGRIKDMYQEGIIEPARVKKQSIISASEVAVIILRIDDIIGASQLGKQPPPRPEGM